MAYSSEYKSKMLYEEKKQKDLSDKLHKIQTYFNDFDKGKLTPQTLINKMENVLEMNLSSKLERLLKNPSFDCKNFRSVLKNLDILKDNKTEYRQASAKIKDSDYRTFERAKSREDFKNYCSSSKTGIFPQPDAAPEKDVSLKNVCQQFVKSDIGSSEFIAFLKHKGVNIENDKIQKAINSVNRGELNSFSSLYSSICVHKQE